MSDLTKYANNSKPQNHGLLKNYKETTKPNREKIYTKSITISISETELNAIDKISEETGAGRSAIIRRLMKKGGLEANESQ